MKRIKKIKRRVAALVMSFFLTLGFIAPAFNFTAKAEAVEVMNGACTVADMIFSYCASGGVAIMNETIIDEVYNTLGSSFGTLQTFVDNGLLTYSNGTYVDTGLSTNISSAISSINSIDIGAMFNQTAEQSATGIAITGAASLGGIAASVASTGFLPLIAGVAIEGWAGFQLGTLIANEIGLYGKNVTVGVPLDTPANILNKIPNGQQCITCLDASGSGNYLTGYITFSYKDNKFFYYGVYNPYDSSVNSYRMQLQNGSVIWEGNIGVSAKSYTTIPFRLTNLSNYNLGGIANSFDNSTDFNNALNGWQGGTITPNKAKSPDLVGTNGNLLGNYNSDDNAYTIPDAIPQVDPNTQSVNPTGLSFDDWLRFANDAKGNYTNGNPDLNADILTDILDAIRINSPTPVPNPVPDPDPYPDPNPDPETVPVTVPTVNPYPDTYPVADPDTVPVNKEQPQYTEKATENETDIVEGDPYTTPDLLDKFPFCIPRDILRSFKKLDSGSREAPHIQWRFHPNEMIDYTFDVDFSTWENVAVLLRLLELIAFIVLLGAATRNLILS